MVLLTFRIYLFRGVPLGAGPARKGEAEPAKV